MSQSNEGVEGDKAQTKPTPKTPTHEKDQGFNESHGYPPGHGGPTGPGDAPAGG